MGKSCILRPDVDILVHNRPRTYTRDSASSVRMRSCCRKRKKNQSRGDRNIVEIGCWMIGFEKRRVSNSGTENHHPMPAFVDAVETITLDAHCGWKVELVRSILLDTNHSHVCAIQRRKRLHAMIVTLSYLAPRHAHREKSDLESTCHAQQYQSIPAGVRQTHTRRPAI